MYPICRKHSRNISIEFQVCAKMYLNGDGMGKGSHLSLFFVIMCGDYDALLPWPFRQKVSFKLIDQGGDQHIVDSFTPDPNSSSFQRPTSKMNIASGCPKFVPKSVLKSRGYIKDNAIILKITVDPTRSFLGTIKESKVLNRRLKETCIYTKKRL